MIIETCFDVGGGNLIAGTSWPRKATKNIVWRSDSGGAAGVMRLLSAYSIHNFLFLFGSRHLFKLDQLLKQVTNKNDLLQPPRPG